MTRAGIWFRATALAALAGTGATTVSGVLGGGGGHRVLAATTLPPLAALVVASAAVHRRLLPASLAALAAFLAAAAVREPRLLHLAVAAAAVAACSVVTVSSLAGPRVEGGAWRDYVTLTKPRIMSLLLVTGVCGMIAAAHGMPSPGRFLAAVLGLALACGGASALNHLIDADIDRLMGKRTASRPVAAGRVPGARALEFGVALSAFSFVLLAGAVNLLAAVLALGGNLFYVVVYTLWLKRRTSQNIVIGGAAGAVPPLVGWAAGSGHVTWSAVALFAIVVVWTPPHFWALALLLREHYARANVPMLPVVRGERATSRQIVVYSVALTLLTAVPWALGLFGDVYLVAAVVLGAVFVALAVRLLRSASRASAVLLFHYSLVYLALLFAAVAVDLAA
ncbi:MAG TPA: heme o synthase [Gaiellaceae bacterium]